MRIVAAILLGTFCLISVGCVDGGVMLQDSQQGEWSNFHKLSAKVSKPEPSAESAASEK